MLTFWTYWISVGQPPSEQFHIFISQQTLYIPWCVLGVKTCQHTGWPGQYCCGLTGLTNCLVYVCLSAAWINLAWLDYGLSVCYPIIFPKPGPLNSLLLGQTSRSHVCCSCVTEGYGSVSTASMRQGMSACLWLGWAVCVNSHLQQKHYCMKLHLQYSGLVLLDMGYNFEGAPQKAIVIHLEERKKKNLGISVFGSQLSSPGQDPQTLLRWKCGPGEGHGLCKMN